MSKSGFGGTLALVRPTGLKALSIVQFVMAAIAIPSGAILLADPSGSVMGGNILLPHLKGAIPFVNDFTPIGLWLVVYGLAPIVLGFGLLMNHRLAWIETILLGVVEVSWIGTELVLFYDLGFNIMYVLIGGIGIITLGLGLLPSIRKHYSSIRKL